MPIEIAGITDADLDTALANISVLPPREQQQLLAELNELEKTQTVEKRQNIMNFNQDGIGANPNTKTNTI